MAIFVFVKRYKNQCKMKKNKQQIEFDELKAEIIAKLSESATGRIMEQYKLEASTCLDELLPVMRLNRAWFEWANIWKLINGVSAEALERNKIYIPFSLEEYREYAKEIETGL